MSDLRERRIREREQIFKECSGRIDVLSLNASAEIEKKYREMYGDNWRRTLPYESSCMLEETIRNEKMVALARIRDCVYSLKSNITSEETTKSFRR